MTFGLSGAALGGIVAGAGAIGGALISSNASKGAAQTQQQSATDATAAQVGMFNTQVGLQEPWRQAGIAGLGELNSLLGLRPAPSTTMTLTQGPDGVFAPTPSIGPAAPAGFDEQAYLAANSDVARYIAAHPPGTPGATTALEQYQNFGRNEGRSLGPPAAGTVESDTNIWRRLAGQYTDASGNVDSEALNRAVWAESARQKQAAASTQSGTGGPAVPSAIPQPGSLLTNPGAGMHPFTAADFTVDPGYQFRQDQQRKALTAAASAQGGFGSGKYLKDAMTYSGDLASQEYGAAYGRYNTDQTNQYNRTVNDQTNMFNRLAAVSGIGQTSANTLTGAAGTLGGQIGSNIIGAGNAVAAGQVGSANALNGAVGQGISMYQTNQLLNRFPITGYGGVPYSPGVASFGDYPVYGSNQG